MSSFTIFSSQYHQLIVVILAIILVLVDQCGRNKDVVMTWPISNTKECVRGLAHSSVLEIGQDVTEPNRKQYYAHLFSKTKQNKTKWDDGDVFWWISGHVSLLKLMLKMIIVSLSFKSISFPPGNITIIWALRVAITVLINATISLWNLHDMLNN